MELIVEIKFRTSLNLYLFTDVFIKIHFTNVTLKKLRNGRKDGQTELRSPSSQLSALTMCTTAVVIIILYSYLCVFIDNK